MSEGEFDIIESIFASRPPRRSDVHLGAGDDCAVLAPPPGRRLAVSVDTMVEGVHFTNAMAPDRIGHRSLAVSLSDLAAMGAEPAWATLALTVPRADLSWLREFHAGFANLASAHGVDLVGGDLTKGPLAVSVQVHGFLPQAEALLRSGAQPGDRVVVTGTVGDAAGGLACTLDAVARDERDRTYLLDRFERPEPRIAIGRALCGQAHSAIDVSDGLLQDLGHILRLSGVGAEIDVESVPRSAPLRRLFGDADSLRMALSGGDDYELCFTCAPQTLVRLRRLLRTSDVGITEIGTIVETIGLRINRHGVPTTVAQSGFRHF